MEYLIQAFSITFGVLLGLFAAIVTILVAIYGIGKVLLAIDPPKQIH
jgi:hypothetical protein